MSYFAIVSFDIKNGDSSDYQAVYDGFSEIGLNKFVVADSGKEMPLPTTTVAGEQDGTSSSEIRNAIREHTKSVYKKNKLHGEVFVFVGSGWSWGFTNP